MRVGTPPKKAQARAWAAQLILEQRSTQILVVADSPAQNRAVNHRLETELQRLDAFFRRAARESAADENAARRTDTPPLELDIKLIGDRPGGTTAPDAPLVQLALAATRACGFEPHLDCSSTDSNIAIAQGLAALTIGAGGQSGNSHTLEEWYDPRGRDVGLRRALLLMLGAVGLANHV